MSQEKGAEILGASGNRYFICLFQAACAPFLTDFIKYTSVQSRQATLLHAHDWRSESR
jgi:hypothetical protein